MSRTMRFFALTAISLLVSSCASFQSVESLQTQRTTTATQQSALESGSNSQIKLQAVYTRYKGTPYRYGGTDSSGFDCSGFIGTAYQDAFNLSLPRTTEQLAVKGQPIRRDQLKAGDIIIFKTSVKQLHAGIYTGGGKFIHASTSKGVIESSLENQYWHQRYIKARRYL